MLLVIFGREGKRPALQENVKIVTKSLPFPPANRAAETAIAPFYRFYPREIGKHGWNRYLCVIFTKK
jgi:hypothetical protein